MTLHIALQNRPTLWDAEMQTARNRAQWDGTGSPLLRAIATAHDEIATDGLLTGRLDWQASHTRWAAVTRLELAQRSALTWKEATDWGWLVDDLFTATLVRHYAKRANHARYDRATLRQAPDDMRWIAQAKQIADMGMAISAPHRRMGTAS